MRCRTLVFALLGTLIVTLAPGTATTGEAPAPNTDPQPVTEIYHGVSVSDPYRWLEDWNDPRVQQWSDVQDRRARAYLDGLPYRRAIYDRLYQQISATSASYYGVRATPGKVFALYNKPPKNQPMIVLMGPEMDPSRARIVVDPNLINPKGTTAIDWYVPSPDGSLLAISMSENGSEDGSVHVFAVDSGKQVYEVLPRVQYPTGGGSLAWRADSKGFWYTRYPGEERPEAERHFYMAVYFHELGQDAARDAYVFGKDLPKIAEIALDNRQNGRYVLASVANGDGGEFAHYLIAPGNHVTQITRFSDQAVAATVGPDDQIYLVSRQDAPRGKLLSLPASAPVLARARVLVPQSDGTLLSASEANGSPIIVTTRRHLFARDCRRSIAGRDLRSRRQAPGSIATARCRERE